MEVIILLPFVWLAAVFAELAYASLALLARWAQLRFWAFWAPMLRTQPARAVHSPCL